MKYIRAIPSLIVSLILSFSTQDQSQAESYNIGVITDLSAGMSIWGKQTVVGARMAQESLAKEGVSINLLVDDHQLSAQKGLAATQKLLASGHVDAAYIEFTAVVGALAPVLNAHSVPFVYAAAATSPLTAGPWGAKTYINYVETCREAANTARARGLLPLGLLQSVLEYGELCAEGIRQSEVPFVSESYNAGDDLVPQILRLKRKGVRALAHAGIQPDMLKMYQSLEKLQFNPTTMVNDDALPGAPADFVRGKKLSILAFSSVPDTEEFRSRLKAFDPANSLENSEAALLSSLHIIQLGHALAACKKESSQEEKAPDTHECAMRKLLSSPAQPEIGFEGFVDRSAKFRVTLVEKSL